MTDECIFCQIARGKIPCAKIFENDHVFAFLDINPWSEGHSLVIPKEHFAKLDRCPSSVMSAMAEQLPPLASAIVKAVQADGYNILHNNGQSAGQLVQHVHFHIIPRKQADGIIQHSHQGEYPPGRMQEIADKISFSLKSF